MQGVPWALLLEAAAISNAVLLGAVLLFDPRLYRTRARVQMALLLLAYALALSVFTAMDGGWLRSSVAAVTVEYTAGLVAGALLVAFVAGAVRLERRVWPFYGLPAGFALVAALSGERVVTEQALTLAILMHVGLTAIATGIFWQAGRSLVHRPRHVFWLLGGIWLLHLAQLLRLALPRVGWLFDAVPLVGAGLMLGLTLLVVTDSRSLRAMIREPSRRPAGPQLPELDGYMRSEKPHLDPGLDLARLAQAVGVGAPGLSAILSNEGLSFYEFVNRHRVEEAKRLLRDPRERRTSIEAVGMMSGFRARSTFYEAFRKVTGQTPAEYRRVAGD